jgi:CBS-domain-containing membrane protein
VVLAVLGSGPWAAALAVGLAILAMQTSGTFHPPAGIDPLLVVANGLSWSYLATPVAVGAVLLAAFAFVWHRAVRQHPWPARWW